jgi:fermentation-respiration switch protein FrsA (DUF1100 family)
MSDPRQVTFKNGTIDLAAALYLPDGHDETKVYPALVLATPGSSVKEQIGATYAEKMAAQGFVAITFDPSYQGESGGTPRDLEDPATRVEDIRCAVDYLLSLSFVDANRVAMLGICAGGGYAVNAAMTDHRIKALGTVVASDMGKAFRAMQSPADTIKLLEEVGEQRSIEARGGPERRDPWIPDSLAEARAQGVTDRDVLDAVTYYRETHRHPRSTNRLYFASKARILGFDGFGLVSELLTQPLQVIVGGRKGITHSYENGEDLFRRAKTVKDFYIVDGAGHYEMYWVPEYVDQAVLKLASFYAAHLGAEVLPTPDFRET